jgi:hypothetical protein
VNKHSNSRRIGQAHIGPISAFGGIPHAGGIIGDVKTAVESIVGVVEWKDASCGYCQCPGHRLHTSPTGAHDCKVFLNNVPTLYCFHKSCTAEIVSANVRLRRQLFRGRGGGRRSAVSATLQVQRLLAARRAEAREHEFQSQFKAALPEIIHRFAWSEEAMRRESDFDFTLSVEEHWRLFLRMLFPQTAVIWIGEKEHTGSACHWANFMRIEQWLESRRPPPGPFICPSPFATGVVSRKNANVIARPFLVLDGDAVDPECAAKAQRGESLTDADKARNLAASVAVINWLRSAGGLTLHAVVDAGNKSAHGWFAFPESRVMSQLARMIKPLGFDPATLRPSQPVRLPGVYRPGTGRAQRILFLHSPIFTPLPNP